MTEKMQIFKCEICGNIVEMVHGGKGSLVCCGQPMGLYKENSTDAAEEKHVPVVEKIGSGYKVRVGSAAHPMEEDHYIEWIELIRRFFFKTVFKSRRCTGSCFLYRLRRCGRQGLL